MAEERAERFHPEDVTEEVRRRLLEEAKQRGDFSKVHPYPASYNEVVDEPEAKLTGGAEAGPGDKFGLNVALSADGSTALIGAPRAS